MWMFCKQDNWDTFAVSDRFELLANLEILTMRKLESSSCYFLAANYNAVMKNEKR